MYYLTDERRDMTSEDKKQRTLLKKLHLSKTSVILGFICLVAIGAGIFFYMQYKNAQDESSANARLLETIGKTVQLPSETPMVVTVVDKAKLSNKQLATKVEDGDIMMIFAQSKRLVVYRPGVAKVVDMLSFGSEDVLLKDNQK